MKPSNVFMKDGGGYKVGDFGASWAKKTTTQATTVAGTTYYFSPELRVASMAVGKKYDPFKSDVYSLGVTVLHMAKLEFIDDLNNFEESELTPVVSRAISSLRYSPAFKQLLSHLLEFRPDRRHPLETILPNAKAMLDHMVESPPAVEETKTQVASWAQPSSTSKRRSPEPVQQKVVSKGKPQEQRIDYQEPMRGSSDSRAVGRGSTRGVQEKEGATELSLDSMSLREATRRPGRNPGK